MMYCPHCAKKIDENKIEAKSSSFDPNVEIKEDATISYVCPRCGHLIHAGLGEKEVKSLSQAAHAQIQRARNNFASGMGMVSIGTIALILSILFFFLAKKPTNQYQLVVDCAEFYVFVVLLVASVILLAVGGSFVGIGIVKKQRNSRLLKDINNRTFVQ